MMKNYIAICGFLFFGSGIVFAQSNDTGELEESSNEIHWLSFEEALELNRLNPKKWVIDVSTSWCGWCKKMDKDTFQDSLIVQHVNANYYAVALDGEGKDDITIDDRTFKFVASGRRGYHELPAELMGGKMSYPTIIFLGEELQNLSAVPGYKGPKDFLAILEFFELFDPETPVTWTDFMESYVSPYPDEL
ncbi:MAG: thioredoxin-related protein [Crocinitomicaceae bacterium]|jgi:thioredoxin-related protein